MFDSFVFFALLILAALVLGPVGFFMTLGLRGRLARAEQRVAELEARLAARSGIRTPSPRTEAVPEEPQEVQAPPPEPAAPPVAAAPAEVPPPEATLPRCLGSRQLVTMSRGSPVSWEVWHLEQG